MYKSPFDAHQALEIAFDPLRLYHKDNAVLQWPEFPYKQVVVDNLMANYPGLSMEAAAGALLMGHGNVTRAVFELNQHVVHEHEDQDQERMNPGWKVLEQRFVQERTAFAAAKRQYLAETKQKVQEKLDQMAQNAHQAQQAIELQAWQARQIVKRYGNGSKYDGDGIRQHNVLIPHGKGTLYVPLHEHDAQSVGDIKRVPRYAGMWMHGLMHGKGTYYWKNGDSWEGNFLRDEMQGKGIYRRVNDANAMDSSRNYYSMRTTERESMQEARIRFYDASQHVCWGDELVAGCRIKLFGNRHYGDPLVSAIKRYNVDLEEETECVIVEYDATTDRFHVRKDETEDTKWVSLQNSNFRVVRSRPITRFTMQTDAIESGNAKASEYIAV